MTITPAAPAEAFCHEALFYDGETAYLEGTVPFLREGVRAGEPVMVVVREDKIALLRDPPPLHRYARGSYGPQKMHELIAPRSWWLPET